MKPRRLRWPLWLSLVVVVAGVGGVALLVCEFAQFDDNNAQASRRDKSAARSESTGSDETKPATVASVRRMPVAGAPGYFVTVNPDGSSFMEEPDGKRVQLATAGKVRPPVDMAVRKAIDRVTQPPEKVEVSQFVVCAKGVVNVPKDVVVTFVGEDKVVTHGEDGSSAVYYTDGRVVRRDRVPRKGERTDPSQRQ